MGGWRPPRFGEQVGHHQWLRVAFFPPGVGERMGRCGHLGAVGWAFGCCGVVFRVAQHDGEHPSFQGLRSGVGRRAKPGTMFR